MDTPTRATYFATVSNGEIVQVTEAFPEHELVEGQIAITKAEFYLLKSFHGGLEVAQAMLTRLQEEIYVLERSKIK